MARIPQQKEKNFTVFGTETEFDGVLEFTDNLVISGTFTGTINATGNLELAKSAVCSVDTLKVESLILLGSLTGNVQALNRVEMCSGSFIKGNVLTSRLRIADDVNFDGEVTMLSSIKDIDVFSMSGEELKKTIQEKISSE